MSDRPTELLGLPIEGEYSRYNDGWPSQRTLEELQPLIKAVWDDPEVHSFGWTQYTPYFNDGEACIFGTGEVWVKPISASEENTEEDLYYDSDRYNYEVTSYPYGDKEVSPKHHLELSRAIDSGEFYAVLLDTFGDPAEVTFSKEDNNIKIEYYEHD